MPDHDRLLQILKSIGVEGMSMIWFANYLKNWQQVVRHNNKTSEPRTINRGEIQGENNFPNIYIYNCRF